MNTRDHLVDDFTADAFQKAFKQYFQELGVNVTKWDALFAEMNSDPNGKNQAYVRMAEDGTVIGFIQFTAMKVSSWFFETRAGFIREFWIAQEYRGQGHGSQLLAMAEACFVKQGLAAAVLTTDTAPAFYEKHGYVRADQVCAKNEDPVFIKPLCL